MTKRRKQALYILGISIPSFSLGFWFFEIGGGGGAVAMITALLITLGAAGIIASVTMLFTKNRLGWFDSELPKPIIKKEKEMSKKDGITKEKPITQEAKKGSSVDLMKREKELLNRRDELNRLLEEAETQLTDVRENLETKGWVNSDDGWVIE